MAYFYNGSLFAVVGRKRNNIMWGIDNHEIYYEERESEEKHSDDIFLFSFPVSNYLKEHGGCLAN